MSQLYAPAVFDALNGVFCVYKPAGKHVSELIHALKTNLSRELNLMQCRPPRQRVLINCQQTDASVPAVTTVPDLADHPLVMAIGKGMSLLKNIHHARYLRVYHVQGQLGLATHNFSPNGRVIEKTTYNHVGHARLDRVVSAMQAGHQRFMFTAAGVDIQSQEAYEMASQGLLRPLAESHPSSRSPVLYGIRCIHFKPPDFTLEVHAINESSAYLAKMIHEIGLEVRSSAVCTSVRRIRYGNFTLSHALLTKHCDARSISENIDFCRPLVDESLFTVQSDVLTQRRTDLQPEIRLDCRTLFDLDSPAQLPIRDEQSSDTLDSASGENFEVTGLCSER